MSFLCYAVMSFVPPRNNADAALLARLACVNKALRVVVPPHAIHSSFTLVSASGISSALLRFCSTVETAVFSPSAKLQLDEENIFELLPTLVPKALPYLQALALEQSALGSRRNAFDVPQAHRQRVLAARRQQQLQSAPAAAAPSTADADDDASRLDLFHNDEEDGDPIPPFSFERAVLEPLFSALPRIEKFSLSFSPCLLQDGSAEQLFALVVRHLPFCRSVCLNGCQLRTLPIDGLLPIAHKLRELSARNNGIGGALTISRQFRAAASVLTTLDLSSNRLVGSLEFLHSLPKSVQIVNCSFCWLSGEFNAALLCPPPPPSTSDNNEGGSGGGVDEEQSLFLPQLHTLLLNNNNLSGSCASGLALLSRCMPHIVRLQLHSNDLEGELGELEQYAAVAASEQLLLPASLAFLSLYGNRIAGAFPHSYLLAHSTLQELTVTNNRLTALDEYAFDALPRRLELLSFDKNMLSSSKMPRFIVPPAQPLQQAAAPSKLRFLYLSDCGLRGTLDLTHIGAKFPLLDTFHAGGNNLERLAPSNALSSAVLPPRIRYVDLSNNPSMRLQPLQTDVEGGGEACECLDLTNLGGCRSLLSLNLARTGLGGTLRLRTVSLPPSLTIINACFCAFTTLELDASGGPCHLDALYLNNNAGLTSSEPLDVCALGMLSVNRLDLGGTSIACTFPTTAEAVPAARRARPFFMLICGPRDDAQQRAEMLALLRASNKEARLRFFPPSAWQQLGIGYEEWEDEEVRSSRKAAEAAEEDE